MKVTNISNKRIYLKDLKILHESQTEGRRGEDVYLDAPGTPNGHPYVYLPETSEVLRSASYGDIRKFRDGDPTANPPIQPSVIVDDTIALDHGATITINHNFNRLPNVTVLKQVMVGPIMTWVDATGLIGITHDAGFTQTVILNASGVSLTFLIKVS